MASGNIVSHKSWQFLKRWQRSSVVGILDPAALSFFPTILNFFSVKILMLPMLFSSEVGKKKVDSRRLMMLIEPIQCENKDQAIDIKFARLVIAMPPIVNFLN